MCDFGKTPKSPFPAVTLGRSSTRASPTKGRKGIQNQNVDPFPGKLLNPIWPPINSTNCFEMASPNPEPECPREALASPWEKGWNMNRR